MDYLWSDIDIRWTTTSGQIDIVKNIDSILQSIKTILGTRRGERIMVPEFGSNLHEFLFAPMSDAVALGIKSEVEDTLYKWENRIEILDITVTPLYNDNVYEIHIDFIVVQTSQRAEFVGKVRSFV